MSEEVHDRDVRVVQAPQSRVLALLRILAGRRGTSAATWSGQGFVYTLQVRRGAPVPTEIDSDPQALHRELARDELLGHLQGP